MLLSLMAVQNVANSEGGKSRCMLRLREARMDDRNASIREDHIINHDHAVNRRALIAVNTNLNRG